MEFEIEFISLQGEAINIDSSEIGTDALDLIREKGGQDIPLKKIKTRISSVYKKKVIIAIPEKIARESGYFHGRTRFYICVPECFLNEFIYQEAFIDNDSETNEIQLLGISWVLNEPQIIEAWKEAGYPENWK